MTEREVRICQYINCQRQQASDVLAAFEAQSVPGVTLVPSDCLGQCNLGATVYVLPDEIWYSRVRPEDVPEIVEQHLRGNEPVARLLHPRFHPKFNF